MTVDPIHEQALFLASGSEELFAVLTKPSTNRPGNTPDPPGEGAGVIILAGGRYEQSSGRNRVARRMAHSFAAIGLHVLRFDYHGVGESTGRLEEFALDEPNLDDLEAAIGELKNRGVDRISLVGDCFGARTALAGAARLDSVTGLVLVSLPWRDLSRGNRKAAIASSRLTVGDYIRKGSSRRVLMSLRDPDARRVYWQLILGKVRHLRTNVENRVARNDLEPWVSKHVVNQLETVLGRRVPVLLLYGAGAVEENTADLESLRQTAGVAHVLGPASGTEIRVLSQPIAGYRNLCSQDEVVTATTSWFDAVLRTDRIVA